MSKRMLKITAHNPWSLARGYEVKCDSCFALMTTVLGSEARTRYAFNGAGFIFVHLLECIFVGDNRGVPDRTRR